MGRSRRRRRNRNENQKAWSSVCPGDTEIHGASAMLLYEAPFGIALFSLDGAYLNNSPKDFWADIPPLTLEFFLKYERVSTPIDLTNDTIDDYLVKKLTRHCGSEKKLVVGRAQYKTIIENKLAITCLHVGVPHCEVINCSLQNPVLTSLPEEKSEMNKTDPFSTGEELIAFLSEHDFDFKPEMVNEPIAKLARQLHGTRLRQIEILKFLHILLDDFIVRSGIDTKRWKLFHFVTVPKMICYPESSYEIYDPDKIFLRDEYRKIEANASRYRRSFAKIDVLSFYEEVVSLYTRKCILYHKLDSLLEKAKGDMKIHEASAMLLYDAPFGIALFSFDGAYLNNSMKDFWTDIPQFSLEEFITCEKVSTLFDPDNKAIDDHLAKELTRHCGSEKKLVVGSAQRKRVIEEKLGITCLHVPELEVINCPLMSPMRTSLPQEKSETNKMDPFSTGEELITFLRKHNFDIKAEMVNESVAELARQLHETKLRQRELLKFFSILLKDFIVISGIDTANLKLFQFATVPKMICCPGSSYESYHPDKIFSSVEHQKIEANAYRYRTSFSKLGVLSVYEEVVSLYTRKCILLQDLDSLIEKAKGEKIHEASAMLLYDAPFGIALFSFDGAYLNNSMKDFWADIPQFSLEEFIMCEKVSTLFDPDNEAIDDHLAKELTRHCGSEKKLVVGSAQHKRVIEEKLGITCLHVPELEVINCPLMSPMHTLAQEKPETNKTDPFSTGEELITFLRRHNFDIKPEMARLTLVLPNFSHVNESIAELARQLHETKLRQRELLKFFSILLKDFIVLSGIDTANWKLFQFATVPKMVCCPGSSYEIYHPDKIFSSVEYRKIEANASRYRTSFSKIGVLSVYEEVVSLHKKMCLLLHDLGSLLEKDKGETSHSRRLGDLIDEERAREAKGATHLSQAMKQLCMVFTCGQPVHSLTSSKLPTYVGRKALKMSVQWCT